MGLEVPSQQRAALHDDFFSLAAARESYGRPLPRYIEDELQGYLRCGDFSQGFVCVMCTHC
jgi:hypothetical protein